MQWITQGLCWDKVFWAMGIHMYPLTMNKQNIGFYVYLYSPQHGTQQDKLDKQQSEVKSIVGVTQQESRSTA